MENNLNEDQKNLLKEFKELTNLTRDEYEL